MSLADAKNQLSENIRLLTPSVRLQKDTTHMCLYNLSNALINIASAIDKIQREADSDRRLLKGLDSDLHQIRVAVNNLK